MRLIPVLSLGTYYKVRSPVAASDADEMRGFVYLSKNNRPHYGVIGFRHPNHPRRHVALRDAQEAWLATAETVVGGRLWEMALGYLKRSVQHPALVPIPASCTTAANIDGRWAARGLAEAIASQGLGRVVLAVVNKQETEPTRGKHVPPSQLVKNLCWYDHRFQSYETVVYVDDVLTWGNHIAAVDSFMRKPQGAMGITVACTDGVGRDRAIQARLRNVRRGLAVDDVTVENVAEYGA